MNAPQKDVEYKTGAAYVAFRKLIKRVLNNKDLQTEIMVYNFVAISTLLYGCETWTITSLYPKIRKLSPAKDLSNLEHQMELL